jgi:DNA polymerase-3 subunit epsilon
MKLLFLDTETTGIDPEENGIWQIAGIIDDTTSNIGLGKFAVQMAPDKSVKWDLKSFAQTHKINKAEIINFMPHTDALTNAMNDRYIIVGYNIYFDIRFLRNWFLLNDSNDFSKLFWGNYIDVQVLASEKLKEIRHKLQDFKLETICKHYGIPVDMSKTHDAEYDTYLVRTLYYHLIK